MPEAASGDCQLSLSAVADDRAIHNSQYSTYVASRVPLPDVPPELYLLPTPKQLTIREGAEPFPIRNQCSLEVRGGEAVNSVGEYLAEQLRSRLGLQCRLGVSAGTGSRPALILSNGDRPAHADMPLGEIADHGPEAYALRVGDTGVIVAAVDARGLRHGAMTLLQLLSSAISIGPRRIPALDILDWPSLPIRGITIPLPTNRWGHPNDAPVDPDFWQRFLLRTCLEHKLNTIVMLVRQGMQYNRHPRVSGPAAWDQSTLRRIVESLKSHDINVIPLLDSLGHANWLVIPIERLREDGDTHTLCTGHPDSKKILFDCYEECIDVFRPTHFHMGLDEIRWKTFDKPEGERCKLCRGVPKTRIFLDQVNMLREFLTGRGITPMMWGDMLLKKHGGGPPFHLDRTLPQLPKDIVITNWSITLDPLSNHMFQQLGFPVIQSNSRGVTPTQAPWVKGNFFGVWAKHPWLTDGAMGPKRTRAYSYLSILTAAEYSWNLYPDPMALGVPLDGDFFADRLPQLSRLGLAGPIGDMQRVALTQNGAPPIEGLAGRCTFAPAKEPLAPIIDKPASMTVESRVEAVYPLLSCAVPAEHRDDFSKLFQEKHTWDGVAIAELALEYTDGTEAVREIMHGVDVVDAVDIELPFTYRAIDYWTAPDGRTWHALQWANPHPEKPVETLTFRHTGTPAQPLLKAVSIQLPRPRQ